MAFNGSEGGQITLAEGAELTENYRQQNSGSRKGHFFGKEILKQLLSQDGCEGIRMYYGINNEGQKELVLVGADADENDILDIIADISAPCPSRCGKANSLNS